MHRSPAPAFAASLVLALALPACGGAVPASSSTTGAGGAITGSGGNGVSSASTTGDGGNTGSGAGGASSAGEGGSTGSGGVVDPGPSTFAIATVDENRNRLLDTYASHRGSPDRCAFWGGMTIVEKGIFLTHTDMLGHRSCFDNAGVPAAQLSGGACSAASCTCQGSAACSCAVGSAMALDHVFRVWAINGTDPGCCGGLNCCNGGGEWHRTFFSADDQLLAAFRSIHAGLPLWAESNDLGGPHAPFTQSDETVPGSPRGQVHFWSNDGQASVLQRNGVQGLSDPHVVELDNDYNWIHDSSPEGYYSFTYGRAEYKRNWNWPSEAGKNRGDGLPTTFLGNGAPADISEIAGDSEWSPSCAAATVSGLDGAGGVHPGAKVVIGGAGFLASGNRVHLRTRSMAVVLDAASPLFLAEAPGSITVQLPKDLGTGEGFVAVEAAGALSNQLAISVSP